MWKWISPVKKERHVIIATEPQVSQATRNMTVRALLENSNANPGGFAKVYGEFRH